MDRRDFLKAAPLLLSSAILGPAPTLRAEEQLPAQEQETLPPEVGRSSDFGSETARFTLRKGSKLRLMQMTDLHFGTHFGQAPNAEDTATIRETNELVQKFTPQLLISTGDNWWDNNDHRGQSFSEYAINQISALGVPWAFCWGNHDKADDVGQVHRHLASASHSLYRGTHNHGSYRIEVEEVDELGKISPTLDLWILNSNQYGLQKWELDWLGRTWRTLKEKRGKVLPSFAFFHIPFIEYKTLYDKDKISGVMFEEQCCEKSDAACYERLSNLNLRACFCGHDHVNDYMIPTRDGAPALIYGRATGIGAYGGDQLKKGAKMIEIDPANGDFQQKSVFADGSVWHPWDK